jgi:membrane protein YqaA with SNARE-associated domain
LGVAIIWALGYWLHQQLLLPLLKKEKNHRRWYNNCIHITVIGALFLLILLGRWCLYAGIMPFLTVMPKWQPWG